MCQTVGRQWDSHVPLTPHDGCWCRASWTWMPSHADGRPLLLRTGWRPVVVEVDDMTAVSATTVLANLYRLIDQVNQESEPLTMTGQRGNAV